MTKPPFCRDDLEPSAVADVPLKSVQKEGCFTDSDLKMYCLAFCSHKKCTIFGTPKHQTCTDLDSVVKIVFCTNLLEKWLLYYF